MNKLADAEPIADPPVDAEEQSDEIIGIAFRRSLYVIVAALVIAGIVWLAWPKPPPPPPPVVKDTQLIESLAAPEESLPHIAFENITRASGIDFVHVNGATGERLLPETMGAGVAILDYDGDDDLDLFFVNAKPWPHEASASDAPATQRLYQNNGQAQFQDVTVDAGLDLQWYGMGCAVGDIDNDGWQDLLITGVGGNRLFHNQSGKFVDVTERAGVGGKADDWSTAAGFFDYDHDGDLDLVVTHYVVWSRQIDIDVNFTLNGRDRAYGPPNQFRGTQIALYRNRGDGVFDECAQEAGLHVTNDDQGTPVAKALGLLLDDLNRDGWDDIIVANDTTRNFLFLNQRDGTFSEQGVVSGIAYDRSGNSTGAMGIDMAYPWNEQTAAIGIGNFANQMSSFYLSQRQRTDFVDEAVAMGIGSPSRQRLTFGVVFADFDLDSQIDFLQINGHLEDTIDEIQPSQSYRQPAQLFWNRGMDRHPCYTVLPDEHVGDLAEPLVGRAVAFGDLDADGDLDLVVTEVGGPPAVLLNQQQIGNHYLRVKLIGSTSNRFGYGARVELLAGERTATRLINPARSYLSQVEPIATFGLGSATVVERLRVHWPDGRITELANVPADQVITIRQDDATNP